MKSHRVRFIFAVSSLTLLTLSICWRIVEKSPAPQTPAQQERAAFVAANTQRTLARFAQEDRAKAGLAAQAAEEDTRLREACRNVARQAARHPSTVSFPWYGDTTIVRQGPQRSQVSLLMAAKNSFGLELQYQVICQIKRSIATVVAVRETS